MTTRAPAPSHLLAFDLDALGPVQGDLSTLAGQLSSIRGDLVLVTSGSADRRALPEPDYVLEDGLLYRMPAEDEVDEFPVDGEDFRAAAEYLAGALMIPASEVYTVVAAGADAPAPGAVEVRGDPSGDVLVADDEDEIIRALEVLSLLGRPMPGSPDLCEMAFEHALESVRSNISHRGFTAASRRHNRLGAHDVNYASVWARDGVVTGLWTLTLGDEGLIEAFRATLATLAEHQSPSGQIPSNVRIADGRPDYSGIGGIASIDAVLWWVIGVARFSAHTGDREFATEMLDPMQRTMAWLAAHDANNDGLLEIPESSDWMDLFPRSYNVLYDEILWFQAQRDASCLLYALGKDGSGWAKNAERCHKAIIDQFWPTGEQLMEIAGSSSGRFSVGEAWYLLSQITPFDYGWRCDVYANLLAALSGLLDDSQSERLFTFLWGVGVNSPYPVKSLYPEIHSGAEDWKDYFLVNFLNLPGHYHNGGIWPFIGGLWVRYLVSVGRTELAHRELASLAEACRSGIHDEWEFNEWLHGRTGRPMGKAHQAWSSASYIHAYLTLHGDAHPEVFPSLEGMTLES